MAVSPVFIRVEIYCIEGKGNYDNWEAALKHVELYCSTNLMIKDFDERFLKGFKIRKPF
jgi:hypothetical protein